MPVLQELADGRVPVKIWTAEVEASARAQLANIAQLPVVHHHVAAMADVHTGIGATIGAVIATRAAIIPAAVGVDIGCGMIACRLSLAAADLDEKSLRRVFDQIGRDVPVGFAQHEQAVHGEEAKGFAQGLRAITERHPGVLKRVGKNSDWTRQLGTLGGVSLIERNSIKCCQSTH